MATVLEQSFQNSVVVRMPYLQTAKAASPADLDVMHNGQM